MIVLPTKDVLLVILEPGNIRKMKQLQPLTIKLRQPFKEVGLILANDIEFVEKEVIRLKAENNLTPEALEAVLNEDLKRKPIDRGTDELEGTNRFTGITWSHT